MEPGVSPGIDLNEFFDNSVSAVDDSSCGCDSGGGDSSAAGWVLSSHPVTNDLLTVFGLINNVRVKFRTNNFSWSREVFDTTRFEAGFRERILITLLNEDDASFVFVRVMTISAN